MKEILKKIGSKVLGTFAGAMSGIGAGFLPGFYYFLDKTDNDNLGGAFAYLATLPFFIGWQMFRGGMHGAKNGAMAGLTYPQTLNEQFKIPIRNQEILKLLASLDKNDPKDKLSSKERAAFESLLTEKNLSSQKYEKLSQQYATYLDYINSTKSTLSDVPLKEIEHPVGIKIAGKFYVCEQEKLQALVEACQKKQEPVILHDHVISANNLVRSIPESIGKFLTKVRTFFTSLQLINKTLGIKPDASRFDLSLLPAKKVTPLALITYPSPQASAQQENLETQGKPGVQNNNSQQEINIVPEQMVTTSSATMRK